MNSFEWSRVYEYDNIGMIGGPWSQIYILLFRLPIVPISKNHREH